VNGGWRLLDQRRRAERTEGELARELLAARRAGRHPPSLGTLRPENTPGCTTGKRRPLDVVRERLEEDPDAVAEYVIRAIREGRDVRALTAMLDRIYAEETYVEVPHSPDELAKLNDEERRTLMAQLERELGIEPFNADEWRAEQRGGVT
jgi:hypothetical protein